MVVLGFDGGGSTARLALANPDGRVVHRAFGGGVNPLDNTAWQQGFNAAFADIEAWQDRIEHAVFGLPVYGEVAEAEQLMAAAIEQRIGLGAHLLNDVELAHYGAFAGNSGALILSGTGSMAIAGGGDLPLVRVGGWGDELGDEGSAFWIGLRALVTCAWMIDGRSEPTPFLGAMLDHLRVDNADALAGLMTWYYDQPHRRSGAARLARLVDELAQGGDRTALSILGEAADHLALHLAAAERRAGVTGQPWTYAGGTFASASLLDALISRHGSKPIPARHSALAGALLLAARRAGWPADAAWQAAITNSLAETAGTSPSEHGVLDDERN